MISLTDLIPLEIFPTGGLTSSVVTTVWIGIMVVAILNLRFGTTLSGLVVPGYIVPLLLVKPASAWVIIVESLVTYLIARLIADRMLVKFGLGELFGRDRFFMLILISVLVRVLFDAYLLVGLDDWLLQSGIEYEFRSSLHSFGLIIIALSANQFWNSGLKRGLFTLLLHLAITYAIVSYLLIPLTNFNISTLGYMYEDVASNILASPKAYIILISAAFLSSRLNLRYGWDFNGILIPSLLALQWYNPLKILTTFVEAFVILFAAMALLRLPLLRNINIEGARQLLLFFNIGFVYKLLLGYAIILWFPSQKITDLYGFGYLLATLLAIKMYQKNIAIKLTRTTVQTSLMASILASIIGFSLTLYSPAADLSSVNLTQSAQVAMPDKSLPEVLASTRRASFATETVQQGYIISPVTLDQFRQTLAAIDKLTSSPSNEQLRQVAGLANKLGYQLAWVESRYLVLRDIQFNRGWGFFVIDLAQDNQLALQFPTMMGEKASAMVMAPLLKQLNARYLAVASARADRAQDGSDQLLLNSQTLFQVFHQSQSVNNTLQVREYSASLARLLLGERTTGEALDVTATQTKMWIKNRPPAGLSLNTLEQLVGNLDIVWGKPDLQNRQRQVARHGFAELFLTQSAILSILSSGSVGEEFERVADEQQISGYLQSYLQSNKELLAQKFSQQYVVPRQSELLYFDQAILEPLLRLIDQYGSDDWLQKARPLLNQIATAASQSGYQLILYKHLSSQSQYFILREISDAEQNLRHWGTYVFKLGPATPYLIEAPSPVFETGTFEFSGALFQQIKASALLIGGAHPLANVDGSARLVGRDNTASLFNLIHQSVLRHYADTGAMAVQVRGYSPEPNQIERIKLGFYEQYKPFARQQDAFVDLRQYLQSMLTDAGLPAAEERIELVPATYTAQARYTKYLPLAQYAEIWLPRGIRESFGALESDSVLYKQLAALDLSVQQKNVRQALSNQPIVALSREKLTTIKGLLNEFKQSQNIQALATLQGKFSDISIELWQDQESLQSYFVLRNSAGNIVAVNNLKPLSAAVIKLSAATADTDQAIRAFVEARAQWLYRELTE